MNANNKMYDVTAELDSVFGAPGTESRRAAEDLAWQEYNAQILLDEHKATCKKDIPRIKSFKAMDDFLLAVEFDDGYKVIYDVKDDIQTLPAFRALTEVYGLFHQVQLDSSRTCIYWNDEIDLASDSIYEYGSAA